MTTYLLGDSHLARVGADRTELGPDVVNLSVGGAVVDDVPAQLARVDPEDAGHLVLSIGTNDADPARGRPLPGFRDRLAVVLGGRPRATWVLVASPGCTGQEIAPGWTAARIASYADAATALVRASGGRVVRSPAVLAAAGSAAFDPDGFHLSETGYDLLLPALASVLAAG